MSIRQIAAAAALISLAGAAQATDLSKIRYMAANCANCHGTDGKAVGAGALSIAGWEKNRFIETMKGFKDGTRPATLMHQISKGYSDEQIAQLADYFAAQKK